MLPIINRPVLDYVIEDCLKAGVNRFILVINQHNYQPLHYYRENLRLKKYLTNKGKSAFYKQISHIHHKAEFIFVKQTDSDPYGTSIPLLLAKKKVQNENAFFYLTGDDFVYFPDSKRSFAQELICVWSDTQAEMAMGCIQTSSDQLTQFGVVESEVINGQHYLRRIVEKPTPEIAPSGQINISKYLLSPLIFEYLEKQQPNQKSGEYYITDALEKIAQDYPIAVLPTNGKYLNAGDPVSWLKANLTIARDQPEIWQQLELD